MTGEPTAVPGGPLEPHPGDQPAVTVPDVLLADLDRHQRQDCATCDPGCCSACGRPWPCDAARARDALRAERVAEWSGPGVDVEDALRLADGRRALRAELDALAAQRDALAAALDGGGRHEFTPWDAPNACGAVVGDRLCLRPPRALVHQTAAAVLADLDRSATDAASRPQEPPRSESQPCKQPGLGSGPSDGSQSPTETSGLRPGDEERA